MIHPQTELRFISPAVGYGVFATAFIPKGTITYVKDSLEIVVTPGDYGAHNQAMQDVIEKYSYVDEVGNRIVSWDFAKYVNHCCNCNTISTGYGFEIAIRDIQPGEQITDEYGIFNLEYSMELVCDQPGCRKVIQPRDFDNYYTDWDAKIRAALPQLFVVDQPLLSFLDESTQEAVEKLGTDLQQYRSVYALRLKQQAMAYPPAKPA
ncbi:MAG: SET domain-containing protein-lysine N-methyltransferase [Bacteroidetes bacterium]|nr:MAG: SET domain-containing protein-lysine N-methyltransferase [Bacteroidota bacterium]PTM12438.1 MAG: SET domain-containing protein-lysine N-methyltransferase [Bacteroidota bacterium]